MTHDVTRGHVVSGGMDSCVYVWARRNVLKTVQRRSSSRDGSYEVGGTRQVRVGRARRRGGGRGQRRTTSTVRLWRLHGEKERCQAARWVDGHSSRDAALHRPPALRLAARLERARTPASPTFAAAAAHCCGLDFASLAAATAAAVLAGTRRRALVSSRAAPRGLIARPCAGSSAHTRATPLLASRGQDAPASFWDDRQAAAPRRRAPARDGGSGAVSEIAQCVGRRVVTAGADRAAAVLDLRADRAETVSVSSETVSTVASLSSPAADERLAAPLAVASRPDSTARSSRDGV